MNKPSKTGEGRAGLARPSLLFLLALALLALGAAAAPVAQAVTPPIPALTPTNPSSTEFSPALVTNPLILGEGEPSGGHTSKLDRTALVFGGPRGPVGFATKHPEYEIKIFANDPSCTTTAVGEGLASALENPGIQVSVAQDSITTFYARQFDPADPSNPSNCSEGRTYWEGAVAVTPPSEGTPGGGSSTGPPAGGGSARPDPPHLRTIPGGSANDNTPLVTGAAPRASTVRVFASADCSGPVVAKGPAGQFADPGLAVRVVDNVAVVFSAVSASAAGQSDCSPPVLYVEDSLTPHTRITMGPASKTAKHKAIFRFVDTTGDAPGTIFLCKVDKRKWKRCSSPLRLKRLRSKRYLVQVKATDPAGNVERKAAKRKFRVVPRP